MTPHFLIILVRSNNSGNIGAVARAMMNTGFADLRLVDPLAHHLNRECLDRAMMAEKIVRQATTYLTLSEAIKDCDLVVGTSGKTRRTYAEFMTPRDWVEKIFVQNQKDPSVILHPPFKKIALVFGHETNGLSHEELLLCEQILTIPSAPELPSLNISHAAMIVLHEIFLKSFLQADSKPSAHQLHPAFAAEEDLATFEHKQAFYEHLEKVLTQINFLDEKNPAPKLEKLKALFGRIHLTMHEVGFLRGICRQIENRCLK